METYGAVWACVGKKGVTSDCVCVKPQKRCVTKVCVRSRLYVWHKCSHEKGFLGRKKMWLESSGIWFSLPLWKKCRRQQTRSRKGIKSCWWTKLSGAITPARPTALSSSLCLFSQKAFSPPVQINRFLTDKRQWIHMYIQTDASNSL